MPRKPQGVYSFSVVDFVSSRPLVCWSVRICIESRTLSHFLSLSVAQDISYCVWVELYLFLSIQICLTCHTTWKNERKRKANFRVYFKTLHQAMRKCTTEIQRYREGKDRDRDEMGRERLIKKDDQVFPRGWLGRVNLLRVVIIWVDADESVALMVLALMVFPLMVLVLMVRRLLIRHPQPQSLLAGWMVVQFWPLSPLVGWSHFGATWWPSGRAEEGLRTKQKEEVF